MNKTTLLSFFAVVLLVGAAVTSVVLAAGPDLPKVVKLSGGEVKQVQEIATHRHDISIRREQAQAKFQAEINRLQDEETLLNIEAEKLCFDLQKSHKLEGARYSLNEWKGELVKAPDSK